MAAFVYEGTLLFGVVMLFGMIYGISTGQHHAMRGRHGLEAFVFLALGLYFSWFWSKGGQTLAMKTWRIRLVTAEGRPVSQATALLRYLVSWVWFLPGLALAHALNPAHSTLLLWAYPALWIACYALLSFLHPQRQFWHDALCGTRLVAVPPSATASAQD